MKMAVESMEMAPGVIPHPDRVPEHRLLSPKIGLRWRRRYGTFHGWMPIPFRVFASEGIYRRKGDVRGHLGGPHHLVARPGGDSRHPMVWQPLALLRLCFGLRLRVGKTRRFGFHFVQFQKYFLYNFSEIQKRQKTGLILWHLVNRLVPENA
jgi:hypothetical protein